MKSIAETARFQEQLYATGSYRSDPDRPRSALEGFDLWYRLNVIRIVFSASRHAARGEFDMKQWGAHCFELLSNMENSGASIEITGMEHPAALGRPTVYVGNHMSMVEGFVLPAVLTGLGHIAAVAKEELRDYPIFGRALSATDPIWVGRSNPRQDLKTVLSEGKDHLDKGHSVVLFPQATRSAEFDPAGFNSLGIKLARAAGVPVTPVAIKTDFQKNGDIIKDLGPLDRSKRIRFKFGPPLAVGGGSGKSANAEVVRFIMENLQTWRSEESAQ